MLSEDVLECFYFVCAFDEGCCGSAIDDEGDAPQLYCGIVVSLEDGGAGDCYFCVFGVVYTEGVLFKYSCVSLLNHGDQAEEVVVEPPTV